MGSNDSWESENTLYLFTWTKNQIQVLPCPGVEEDGEPSELGVEI